MIVPMFPLPGVFLYPGAVMPLHIFEPRYRSMVDDLMDTSGRLVMATIRRRDRRDSAGAPTVCEIAGLGEIVGHERLPDGRFLIALLGLERVRIHEVDSPHLYRLVETAEFAETVGDPEEVALLRHDVIQRLMKIGGPTFKLPQDLELARLTDLLLAQSAGSEETLITAFGTSDVLARARIALNLESEARPSDGTLE